MDYSYYYDAARQALDLHASMLVAGQHEVAAGAAVRGARGRPRIGQRRAQGPRDLVLSRVAGQHRGVRVHLRARAGGALPARVGAAGGRDLHRPLAPVQVVRARQRRRARGGGAEVRAAARAQVHHQRRLGRAAARLRQSRQLHHLRHATRACSSSSAWPTTSTRRRRRSSARSSSATSAIASSSASDLPVTPSRSPSRSRFPSSVPDASWPGCPGTG